MGWPCCYRASAGLPFVLLNNAPKVHKSWCQGGPSSHDTEWQFNHVSLWQCRKYMATMRHAWVWCSLGSWNPHTPHREGGVAATSEHVIFCYFVWWIKPAAFQMLRQHFHSWCKHGHRRHVLIIWCWIWFIHTLLRILWVHIHNRYSSAVFIWNTD